ncbi:MAG: site-specific DNA-methyltransferase [Phycisphaerales bacterium]
MPRKPRTAPARSPLRLSVDTRIVYCGDNLDALRRMPDACVDLVYIDPPFFSGRTYEILWNETWEQRAFEDRHESIGEYIRFMEERCVQLARVLRPSGSFFLHCDWHAGYHLRLMLDRVFGPHRFRNEIVWRRTTAKTQSYQCFPNNHDTILFYAAGDENTFHRQFSPHSEERLEKHFKTTDPDTGRRYSLSDLTGDGTRKGETGKPWRGFDPNTIGRHWGRPPADMDRLDAGGRVYWSKRKGAWPRLKRYLDELKGVQVDSVWTDIPPINSRAGERVGYRARPPQYISSASIVPVSFGGVASPSAIAWRIR